MEALTIVKEIFEGVFEDAGCETKAEKFEFCVYSLAFIVGFISLIWVSSAVAWMFG